MKTYQFVIFALIGLMIAGALHGRKLLKKRCGCQGAAAIVTGGE